MHMFIIVYNPNLIVTTAVNYYNPNLIVTTAANYYNPNPNLIVTTAVNYYNPNPNLIVTTAVNYYLLCKMKFVYSNKTGTGLINNAKRMEVLIMSADV